MATAALQAMIAAFERALSLDAHADLRERLDPVFWPIGAWVRGRYAVTSPALLVVQSILYSHCELIDPGSEWRLHRHWYHHSALGDLLGEDNEIHKDSTSVTLVLPLLFPSCGRAGHRCGSSRSLALTPW